MDVLTRGVKFNDIHTNNKWGLILTHTDISFPTPKKETIDIPGADGELDFTQSLTGDVKYQKRKITFEFVTTSRYKTWKNLMSEIANYLHGQEMKIILDEDPNFYYLGRAEINQFRSERSMGLITIECDVDPYKYDIAASDEDWLWDPFSFEDGIINETKDIKVEGNEEIIIYGRRKRVVPIITCDNPMKVVFNAKTYNLSAGTKKYLNIEICEGKNVLRLIGKGTVTISYRGGSL